MDGWAKRDFRFLINDFRLQIFNLCKIDDVIGSAFFARAYYKFISDLLLSMSTSGEKRKV
jgi:hypothetical protein